jgi:hypothetical protein
MARWLWFVLLLTLGAFNGSNAEDQPEAAGTGAPPPAMVKTVTLEAATVAQTIEGIANVLSPDTLIQLDADMRAARIAAAFSRREAERYQTTKSLSLHILEGAQKQADTDAAQVALLDLRLQQTWGEASPFLKTEERQKLIGDLSTGKAVLVRLDFPQSDSGTPQNIRVKALSGGAGSAAAVTTLWPAPTGNAAMPGQSFFGIVTAPGPSLRPGDRARVIADRADAQSGVVIPNSALVVFGGETWCYVETATQTFERRRVPLTAPVEAGYLVLEGFAPGTRVVVRGASTLLSREAVPEEDDEEAGAAKAKDNAKGKDEAKPAAKDDKPDPGKAPDAVTGSNPVREDAHEDADRAAGKNAGKAGTDDDDEKGKVNPGNAGKPATATAPAPKAPAPSTAE